MAADGIHGYALTIITRVVDGETDEYGQAQCTTRKTVLEGCNVQPVAVTDLPLFEDANHLPQWKCFSHEGDLVARLLTGDSRIEWDGRTFQPASAAYDYVTADGIGNHTEWWMTEVTS